MPPLTLRAQASPLDDLVLYERADCHLIDELLSDSSVTRTQSWCLPRYRRLVDERTGLAAVRYTKPRFGRAIVEGAVGLHNMERRLRARLAEPHFVDWDMQNAHPQLLLQTCQAHNIKCPALQHYVEHREECLESVCQHYGVTRDAAKVLFLRMIFGGGHLSWERECKWHWGGDGRRPGRRLPLVIQFSTEMTSLSRLITHCNKAVRDFVCERRAGGEEGNFEASVLSTFLQELECRCLAALYTYCLEQGLIRHNVCVLCNDGFMLERHLSRPDLATTFESVVLRATGFRLQFVVKSFVVEDPSHMDVILPSSGVSECDQHRYYLRHLYPARLMWRVIQMMGPPPLPSHTEASVGSGGNEQHQRRGHRRMALVTAAGSYWTDPEQDIRDYESFARELALRHPLHMHADQLTLDEGGTVLRELVFDVDITGFARECPCGQEKRTCQQCELLLEGSALLLRHLLRDEWAIPDARMLWVRSGMKGYHCLVNERRWLSLKNEQRRSLVARLQAPRDMTAYAQTLEPAFVQQLHLHYEKRGIQLRQLSPLSLENILRLYWPCVDTGPMESTTHLFKLPFSVHAVTRIIALPVEHTELTHYSDQRPLTLQSLCEQWHSLRELSVQMTAAISLTTQWLQS